MKINITLCWRQTRFCARFVSTIFVSFFQKFLLRRRRLSVIIFISLSASQASDYGLLVLCALCVCVCGAYEWAWARIRVCVRWICNEDCLFFVVFRFTRGKPHNFLDAWLLSISSFPFVLLSSSSLSFVSIYLICIFVSKAHTLTRDDGIHAIGNEQTIFSRRNCEKWEIKDEEEEEEEKTTSKTANV